MGALHAHELCTVIRKGGELFLMKVTRLHLVPNFLCCEKLALKDNKLI